MRPFDQLRLEDNDWLSKWLCSGKKIRIYPSGNKKTTAIWAPWSKANKLKSYLILALGQMQSTIIQ